MKRITWSFLIVLFCITGCKTSNPNNKMGAIVKDQTTTDSNLYKCLAEGGVWNSAPCLPLNGDGKSVSYMGSTCKDIVKCATEADDAVDGYACGNVLEPGKGANPFTKICIGEAKAYAEVGSASKTIVKYTIDKPDLDSRMISLNPVSAGEPLMIILKVKRDYKTKSLIDALTTPGIEVPGAGGRVWIINHPTEPYDPTSDHSFIAGPFTK